jgi:hypothetical protein
MKHQCWWVTGHDLHREPRDAKSRAEMARAIAADCPALGPGMTRVHPRIRATGGCDGVRREVPYQPETWPHAIVRAGFDLVMA